MPRSVPLAPSGSCCPFDGIRLLQGRPHLYAIGPKVGIMPGAIGASLSTAEEEVLHCESVGSKGRKPSLRGLKL